jgi:hypothetical protein
MKYTPLPGNSLFLGRWPTVCQQLQGDFTILMHRQI